MTSHSCALVAQSVEQRIENARVGGSIPSQGTTSFISYKFLYLIFYSALSFSNVSSRQDDVFRDQGHDGRS